MAKRGSERWRAWGIRDSVSRSIWLGHRLSVKDFAHYRQDLIVGVSIQVSAPLGQYDDSKP
jgi:hypothetical protein